MHGECLEGLLSLRVKSTEFESGRLTGVPGFDGFKVDSLKGLALELTVPTPLDCVLGGVSRVVGKPEGLENVDCTETLRACIN